MEAFLSKEPPPRCLRVLRAGASVWEQVTLWDRYSTRNPGGCDLGTSPLICSRGGFLADNLKNRPPTLPKNPPTYTHCVSFHPAAIRQEAELVFPGLPLPLGAMLGTLPPARLYAAL